MIPESGRSPGGGHDNPLQYSSVGNPIDRGAWWAGYRPWGCKELDVTEHTHTQNLRTSFLPISLGQWVMSLGAPGSAHCLLLQLSVPTELLASRDFSFFSCNLSCTSETLLWFKRQVHPEGRLCISFVGHVIIPASLFFLSRAISDPLGGISGCTSFDKNV